MRLRLTPLTNAVLLVAVAAAAVWVGSARGAAPPATATTATAGVTAATAVSVPPPVEGFPVGWCIRAKPDAFSQAKSAGFEYVELALQDVLGPADADFEKLVAQLDSLGLRVLAGYNPIPKDLKLVGPDVDRARQEAHVRKLLDRAAALKLKFIILNAGAAWRIPDGHPAEQGFGELADFSRRLATAAAPSGITILVQPLRATDSNQITTIAEALKLIDAVDRPNFALMVDYSFLVIQKDDFMALLKSPKALRHVHLSNPANKRTYPMSETESDYAAFFAVLKQINYRGGLSVHGSTTDFAHDAPRAIAFLRAKAVELSR
jgi:sugar phosphate isomerase/epimerase